MSFDDFAKQFSHLDLVHIGPDDWMSEPALHSKKPWRAVLARRRWRSGYNAGGGPNYIGEYFFLRLDSLPVKPSIFAKIRKFLLKSFALFSFVSLTISFAASHWV